MARSFLENLRNLPADAMKEAKGLLADKPKEPSAASVEARRARQSRLSAMEAADQARAAARIAEIHAEMDALFNAPSRSEVGARLVSTPDRSYQPVSLERARLEQQKRMLEDLYEKTKDERTRRDAAARLARVVEELRAA